jgi:Lrp/AsnC family leucine-responsive transcriptional regulator
MGLPGDLDNFDRKILATLQKDNLTSQRDIGASVSLSAAAVHRRIRKLADDGVITANTAVVAPERVGRPITLIVEISVESERPDALEKVKRALAAAPEVQQCYYVTGDVDFIVVLTTRDMSEYESITKRLFFGEANVKRFKTFVCMDRVKATLYVSV